MGQPNHRITSYSKRGRQMTQAKGARIADDSQIPPAIREHNAAIEAKRAAELARRNGKGPTVAASLVQAGVTTRELPISTIRKSLGRPYGR
jgi:hypothetical protein